MQPSKRNRDIVIEMTGDEALVYDLRDDTAHCLDPAASTIWNACDGASDLGAIAARTGFDVAVVEATLERLDALELLDAPASSTRRQSLKKMALIGGATVALPVIRSLTAPTAAQAVSGLLPSGSPCTSGAQCQSGTCNPGTNTCL